MSQLLYASPLLDRLSSWRRGLSAGLSELHFTTTQKVILWSVGVLGSSALAVGVLSRYLARRRARPPLNAINPRIQRALNKRMSRIRSPSGGGVGSSVASSGRSASPAGLSERLSLASGSLGSGDAAPLSPQQLGVMGMEALETSINYWEDALAAFSSETRGGGAAALALTSPEEAEFCREIQELLQNAYLLQERSELLFLDQRSVLFRSESGGGGGGGGAAAEEARGARSRLLSAAASSRGTRRELHSSAESFASAEDQVADLRDFDEFSDLFPELESLELYQIAVKQLEVGIPYRTLRTEAVLCGADSEFLCKLHCVRLALQLLFRDAGVRAWVVDAGRQVLTDLLLYSDREPKEFLIAYEEMLSWVSDAANWPVLEKELSAKGVRVLTFYDVVLDYILLDAFDDLNAPPSSVLAVVRNRWLSNGFKESALTTAVWSVIKAKRRYLQHADGFMSHFYSISEHLLPVLVWGFLGPDDRLREVCQHFKDETVGFITDMFSFHKCRYTTVEELSADILEHMKVRVASITQKMGTHNY